jgi:hypothetical protein
MDNNKYPIWLAIEDVPSMLALMAFISLWGLLMTSATIYCSTLGH